jgi:glycosyltransferase 2 family protein
VCAPPPFRERLEIGRTFTYNGTTMKKQSVLTFVGFAVSIVLLYFSLKGIRFDEIWATIRRVNPFLALTPLIFIGCAICLSSFRWSRVAGEKVLFRQTATAMLIGMFVNNVLPLRLGEVARGYVLSLKTEMSFTYSFSTVLLDRFFDLTGLLLLTFIFFPSAELPQNVARAIFLIIGVLIFCVFMIILMSRESFAARMSTRFKRFEMSFLAHLGKKIVEIQENLKRIGSPLTIIAFVIISFGTWLSMSLGLYCVTLALGVPVNFWCIPFVCALLNMGITVPSSPGYVGVYQFLLVYLLSIFGVPKAAGFTISLLYHASWYVPYTVIGFLLALREHLHVRDIRKLAPKDSGII